MTALFISALVVTAAPVRVDAQQQALPYPAAYRQLQAAGVPVNVQQPPQNGGVNQPISAGGNSSDPFHVFDRPTDTTGVTVEATSETDIHATESARGTPGVVVMRNGRVLQGTVRADSRGYFVDSPRSNLYIPIEHVRFVATDLHDAHNKMCRSIALTSGRRDLLLGRWCLDNNLRPEAAEHFRNVLNFDPGNREARQGLARIEQLQTEQPELEQTATASRRRPDEASESLSRLSGSAVREFVIGVQPILLARCGSVKCHGGTDPSSPGAAAFHLEHVRSSQGNNRAATARNLDAVLKLLDGQFPSQSPLFQHGLQPHGGLVTRAPLDGPAGHAQEMRLRRWVDAIAPERNRLRREDASRDFVSRFARSRQAPTLRDPNVVPAAAATTDNGVIQPDRMARPADAATGFHNPADSPKQPGALTDPFDPTQFNRGQGLGTRD